MPKTPFEQLGRQSQKTKYVELPDQMTDWQLLGSDQVAKITNFTPVHIRRLVHSGKFPAPRLIGDRKLAWRASEIKVFIDNLSPTAPNAK